jgi:hypothetical protein
LHYLYPLLVSGPNDVPGALAYFVYKRSKVEWRDKFVLDHGRQPSPDEEEEFVRILSLPESVASFKQRGEQLATLFANKLLEEKMAALAAEVVQSELATKFTSLESQVASSMTRIEARFDEKKTLGGWLRDIGTSLISGFGLIIILGAAALGYAMLSKMNSSLEEASGVGTPKDQAAAAK